MFGTPKSSGSPSATTAAPCGFEPKKDSTRKRNERYYIQDASIVVFQVENELFRVHRHFFTAHSPFFRTLFSLPQGNNSHGQQKACGDGTEMNPLLLPDVPKSQLEILLDYFYEGVTFGKRITELSGSINLATGQEKRLKLLLDLFYIADRYEFASIRQDALQRIEAMRAELGSGFSAIWSPIETLELATRFSVDEWLMPAYEELCLRENFITLDEAERIGGRKTAVIALARERYKKAKEAAAAPPSSPPTLTEREQPRSAFGAFGATSFSTTGGSAFSTTGGSAFSAFGTPPQPPRPAPAPAVVPVPVSLSAILRDILSIPSR